MEEFSMSENAKDLIQQEIECFPLSGENGFGRDDRKGNTGKSKGQRIKSKENKL